MPFTYLLNNKKLKKEPGLVLKQIRRVFRIKWFNPFATEFFSFSV